MTVDLLRVALPFVLFSSLSLLASGASRFYLSFRGRFADLRAWRVASGAMPADLLRGVISPSAGGRTADHKGTRGGVEHYDTPGLGCSSNISRVSTSGRQGSSS